MSHRLSVELDETVVGRNIFVPSELILPHEQVVQDRLGYLRKYLESLKPYIIIPSVLVCDKTNVIIDGHHRYHALLEMGIRNIPVTLIDYSSTLIYTDLTNSVSKESIIQAGVENELMSPKTSFHHIKDVKGDLYPLIVLSAIFAVNNPSIEDPRFTNHK